MDTSWNIRIITHRPRHSISRIEDKRAEGRRKKDPCGQSVGAVFWSQSVLGQFWVWSPRESLREPSSREPRDSRRSKKTHNRIPKYQIAFGWIFCCQGPEILLAQHPEVTREMAKGHRTEWKIFDRLKFISCIEKIEFYFTLKNRNYFLANAIFVNNYKRFVKNTYVYFTET